MIKSAKTKSLEVRKLVLLALLTAIVVVLQVMASVLPVYPFTLALVLVPIVIGASLIGIYAGIWLGLVFAFVVLISSQAGLFLAWNAPMTIVVVLLRGALAGFAAGFAYKLLEKLNKTAAVITAAVVAPIVNTGVFIIGCYLFFLPYINAWEFGAGTATSTIFLLFIGINFPLELAVNLVLSPTIVRLIQIGQKRNSELGIRNSE